MAIFNSFLLVYQRVTVPFWDDSKSPRLGGLLLQDLGRQMMRDTGALQGLRAGPARGRPGLGSGSTDLQEKSHH